MANLTCMFCLEPESMEVRGDVKGRPFLICGLCNVRAFLRGRGSFRGVLFMQDTLEAIQKNGRDLRDLQRTIDESGRTLTPMPKVPAAAVTPVVPAAVVDAPRVRG